jgi:DNA repair exonuclease SbcCD nuclease subunit
MPKIIHTADLHIGKQFEHLGAEVDKLAYLRQARIDVVREIGKLAEDRAAVAIVVAGDVFDRSEVSDLVVRQTLAAMQESSVPWVLLPGNHDPDGPASVWDRVERIARGPRIRIARSQEPILLADNALAIIPAPLTRRHQFADPTQHFDAQDTPADAARVGLAHGSVRNRLSPTAETHNMIAEDRASAAGLDYLALGDWHSVREVATRTWYAGTPEPDNFDQESGAALVVDVPGPGVVPVVERVCVSRYHWHKVSVNLHSPNALQQMKAAVSPLCARLSTAVIDLSLAGAISLADRNSVELELANLEAGCQVLRSHYDQLLEEPTEADLDDLGRQGFIASVVSRLRSLETKQEDGDSLYARMALRRLYVEHVIGGHQ